MEMDPVAARAHPQDKSGDHNRPRARRDRPGPEWQISPATTYLNTTPFFSERNIGHHPENPAAFEGARARFSGPPGGGDPLHVRVAVAQDPAHHFTFAVRRIHSGHGIPLMDEVAHAQL